MKLYIPLGHKNLSAATLMILGGFEPEQARIVHFVANVIGHLNKANIKLTGPVQIYSTIS